MEEPREVLIGLRTSLPGTDWTDSIHVLRSQKRPLPLLHLGQQAPLIRRVRRHFTSRSPWEVTSRSSLWSRPSLPPCVSLPLSLGTLEPVSHFSRPISSIFNYHFLFFPSFLIFT